MSSSFRLWSYGCGGGSYTSASGIGTTTNFASSNLQGVFTILFGSYFGDWDVSNNFLRAPLCQGKMLTCFWAGRPNWWLHHMGLGENIGYSARITQNNGIYGTYSFGGYGNGWVHVALMGDPTLRNKMVVPPSNVVATIQNHNAVITWALSTQTNVLGYHIYMKNDTSNVYTQINNSLVTGTSYTDFCLPYQGTYTYMVRAMVLEDTWSGTYYNLSIGVTDTANHSSSTTIYVNPGIVSTSTANVFQFTCSGSPSYSYQWFFGDGNSSTMQNVTHTYTNSGSYVATLQVTNACNVKTFTFSINVITNLESFPLGFENFVIYPNPASEVFKIEGVRQNFHWKLKDIFGKEIQNGNSIGDCEIKTKGIHDGVYIIEISRNGVIIVSKKIIIANSGR